MNNERLADRKLQNFLHSAVLLGAMVALLALLGKLVLPGSDLTLALLTAGFLVLALGPRLNPQWILRLHRARPLSPYEVPRLSGLVRELARRADLPGLPRLYYVPSPVPNAFAVGSAGDSAIGVTDGILRSLSERELAGVLAHEMSHVKNHDLRIMGLADAMSRMTGTLAFFGQVVFLLSLPLAMFGRVGMPWATILLLLVAPTISTLLQLALSRTREFRADLDAAQLTGDPAGLASALTKLEAPSLGWLWRILVPYRREPGSPLMRTHPATAERVRRLQSLVPGSRPHPRPPGPHGLRPSAWTHAAGPYTGSWVVAPEPPPGILVRV